MTDYPEKLMEMQWLDHSLQILLKENFEPEIKPGLRTKNELLVQSLILPLKDRQKKKSSKAHNTVVHNANVEPVEGNQDYSPTFIHQIVRLYRGTYPLWSLVMTGCLRKHNKSYRLN